ncbi:restriction endonuclease subunit S [Streptomyces sp. NPDC050844]|uniref:restriction endonuclease subunit S n=1 Tax=Streptomyces sp. NPDC050844 TaxID=3155790 RepID=UPI0033CB6564
MIGKELPKGWAQSTLGEVAAWGSGGTPKSGVTQYYGGDIPWAVSGDLKDAPIHTTTSTITDEGMRSSSAKWVPGNAVLIAMYGATIGKIAITTSAITTNQAVAFAVPDSGLLETRFLFWYLRSQRDALRKSGKGGAQPNISQTILKEWPIPIPPLQEQHRIIEALEDHLSRLDAGDQLVRSAVVRASRLLVALTNITYGHTVQDGEVPAPLPVPAGTADGELPQIPSSWQWKRLGEIAEVVGGVTKDKKKQSDPEIPEVPYLRVANVQRGKIDLSHVTCIRVPEKKAQQLALRAGDVLLNEGGDRDKLGRGWVWQGQIEGAIHQNHVFRARVKEQQIHPKLLSWYANGSGRWFEVNGKQSVNLASISLSKIKLFPVPVPPDDKQALIVERIEDQVSLLEKVDVLAKQALSKSSALRKALLSRAFSGKLVSQDTTDEPASALLARVQAERAAQAEAKPKRSRRPQAHKPTPAGAAPPPAPTTPLPPTAIQQEFEL